MSVIGREIAEGYDRLSALSPSCDLRLHTALVVDDSRERRVILTKMPCHIELEIEMELPDPLIPDSPGTWSDIQSLKRGITWTIELLKYILTLADLEFEFEVLQPDQTIVASIALTGPPCQTLLQGVDSWSSE
jgi:hypothetical protein